MKTKDRTQGSCLCGKICFAVTGPLLSADHCHCSQCRKQHGAAFATYVDFKITDFKWISGEELIKVYQTESKTGWCFCSECGSTLAGTKNGKITSIALGTIDGYVDVIPESHIFVGSKANWHQITDDLPQFEENLIK